MNVLSLALTYVLEAASWLAKLIESIGVAFSDLGNLILTFIKDGFTLLFLEVNNGTITGPSNLAIFMFFLIGIALVIGLTTLIFRIMRNRGNV